MNVDDVRLSFDSGSLLVLNVVLAAIMLGIALDTSVDDFRRALRAPKAMAVGIAAQFLALPAVTWLLTLLLDPAPSIALGMILVACCPPGNISNVLTHRAGGDVALSVSMTAVSNVFAIVLMPLNFAFWGSRSDDTRALLRSVELDGLEMVVQIALIIGLPFVLGIWAAQKAPGFASRAQPWVKNGSLLALLAFIVAGLAGNFADFLDYIGLVLLAVFLHDAIALGLGYLCGWASGLPEYSRRAVSFEVGIRNAGLGLGLVMTFFDGLGGMAIVAGWWGIWDIVAGLLLATVWSRRTATRKVTA
ncbi:bile acid:sodium symporter family protein [Rhodococcus rhodochrous]|uniref:bile acid:sodium symporter family protein n=1 Tax=Rhodococcus rhodochrous TaxID=1829 RepID=UPI001E580963|nr:bile acid:sodium symporter family protein [Rhodococcus rhodochrous]MCD2095922.1 bile acid:sodium symporter family protein [Rhodococcus rhodochrous]MCD2120680.1 bile acid:sodium symporter family protein [Rhodococcus rhodochrous]MCQ4135711.1 bile acid:sodium symporter family protein [Rhodococcus rhodochrous]MDJ0017546.1 bile acid:sodium symporter family protein [Rhodococcus rhodochrous]